MVTYLAMSAPRPQQHCPSVIKRGASFSTELGRDVIIDQKTLGKRKGDKYTRIRQGNGGQSKVLAILPAPSSSSILHFIMFSTPFTDLRMAFSVEMDAFHTDTWFPFITPTM